MWRRTACTHVCMVQAHKYNALMKDTKTPHFKATCCAQHTKCQRQSRKTRNIKAFYFYLCLDTLNFKYIYLFIYLFVRRPYNNRHPDNIFWNGDKKLHKLWNTVGHVYFRTVCHNPERKNIIHDSYKNLKSYVCSPLFSKIKITTICKRPTKFTSMFTIYFNHTFLTTSFSCYCGHLAVKLLQE